MVLGCEEPSGVAVDDFIPCEHELGEELVGVHFVDCLAGVVAKDLILVILVESIALAGWADFGVAIGCSFAAFVKDNKFCLFGTGGELFQMDQKIPWN